MKDKICIVTGAIYYEKFYSKMGKNTFYGMVDATPEKFEFSVKVPEMIRRSAVNSAADYHIFLHNITSDPPKSYQCSDPG